MPFVSHYRLFQRCFSLLFCLSLFGIFISIKDLSKDSPRYRRCLSCLIVLEAELIDEQEVYATPLMFVEVDDIIDRGGYFVYQAFSFILFTI